MPNKGRTAKDLNDERTRRMKKIMGALKERPMTFSEIETMVLGKSVNLTGRRSVQNYLAQLKGLDLVTSDPQTGLYGWKANTEKKAFKNKTEYDLSVIHSKSLLFSTEDNPRMFDEDPDDWLDHIIFCDVVDYPRSEDFCLFKHLSSGYPDVYLKMKEYRAQMDKVGTRGHAETKTEILGPGPSDYKVIYNRKLLPRETEELRQLLIGKLVFICKALQNGIPLQGTCEYCPENSFAFKDQV